MGKGNQKARKWKRSSTPRVEGRIAIKPGSPSLNVFRILLWLQTQQELGYLAVDQVSDPVGNGARQVTGYGAPVGTKGESRKMEKSRVSLGPNALPS